MKVPTKKQGNRLALSPALTSSKASMKVPTKKQGNSEAAADIAAIKGLNESPYEKAGKCAYGYMASSYSWRLNESPYEKAGKFSSVASCPIAPRPQ